MYVPPPRVVMPIFSRGGIAGDTRQNLARRIHLEDDPLEKYGRKAELPFPPRIVYPRVVLYSMHDRYAPEPPTRAKYFLRATTHARYGSTDFSLFALQPERNDWRRN